MHRVLFMTLKFPPLSDIGAKRPLRFVRRLPELGWQPTVLTLPRPRDGQADATLDELIPPDAKIHRDYASGPLFRTIDWLKHRWSQEVGRALDTGQRRPTDGWLRRFIYRAEDLAEGMAITDEWLPFVGSGVRAGQRLLRAQPHSAIYACGDPNSVYLSAWLLHKLSGLPLVLDLRDPWSLDPTIRRLKQPWAQAAEEQLERMIFRDAAAVILNTHRARAAYLERYPELDPARLSVITNAFDDELVDDAHPPLPEPLTIVHFGNYHRLRRAQAFLEALAGLARTSPRPVRFVNYGEFRPDDLAHARSLGLEEVVEVRGYLPYRECLGELRAAHVLLVEQRNDDALQVPGKVYDYLMARRPILSLGRNPELTEMLARTGAGVNVAPDDVHAIRDALASLAAVPISAFEQGLDRVALDEYGAAQTTDQLAAVLSDAAGLPQARPSAPAVVRAGSAPVSRRITSSAQRRTVGLPASPG